MRDENLRDDYSLQGAEPRAVTDKARRQGPVARLDGTWTVLGHAEAQAVARNPQVFSSAVSRFLQLPNGLDGLEHWQFRSLIDRYLTPTIVAELNPMFIDIASETLRWGEEDVVTHQADAIELGATFSVRAMTGWLGWPQELEERLVAWVRSNNAASPEDLAQTTAVAEEFDEIIREVVEPRLADESIQDVTARLVHDTSLGRRLEFGEIVSILRNWTGGDLSSMALCIGVVVQGLAENPAVQERIHGGVSDLELEAMIDEFLRMDSPFVSNRRVATCPVTLAGQDIGEGEQVNINWTSANRDERAFGDPDAFEPYHLARNLVWGAGPHECPGRDLSMAELRAFTRALVQTWVVTPTVAGAVRATYPLGGYISVPVELTRR